jgi:hypothetical protein
MQGAAGGDQGPWAPADRRQQRPHGETHKCRYAARPYADGVASTIRSGTLVDDPTGSPGPRVRYS